MVKKANVPPTHRVAIAGGLVASLLGMLLLWAPLGGGLERWSYDLPFQFISLPAGTNVALIYIDEASHSNLGQQFKAAWDRKLHSRLVRRLTDDHASLILFDIVFSDSEPEKDGEFADAIRDHGKVFLGATLIGTNLGMLNTYLTNAAAGCGPLYFDPKDTLYGVRRIWTGTPDHPSEVWLAAKSVSPHLNQAERLTERWLHYYGEPGSLSRISYYEALDTNQVPSGYFSNKFVFVGGLVPVSFIGAQKDEFETPYSRFSKTEKLSPGVEIHATAFLNLWTRQWLNRFPLPLELGLFLLTGLGLGWGLTMLRPLRAVGVALLSAVLVSVFALILVLNQNWFSWLHVVGVQVPVALAWSVTWNAIRAHVDKRLLMESLSLYFSPARVKQILRQPELLRPGATRQQVSILFSDIAGFSKITEMKKAEDMVGLLNKYYETAIGCIYETDGTVMDLIGDAMFAIWNAPQEQPDHRERACRAALLLQKKLIAFDQAERDLPLQTRVGLHTGEVCVGNIGSPTRFDYAAIGDNVNVASRLEGLNKYLGTTMLATREIQVVVENCLVCRLVGYFKFKGLFKPIEVHELIGPKEREEETKPWREAFAEGIRLFQRKNFNAAELEFNRTLQLRANDGPARFYLERINELGSKQLPDDWKGEIDLSAK